MKILLNNNYGYKWFSNNNSYVRGYFFDECNVKYTGNELLEYFKNIRDKDELASCLNKVNGFFSIVLVRNEQVLLAVDRLRTMPLFYDIEKGVVSDDTKNFNYSSSNFDENRVVEFLNCGYVTGNETLISTIKQCQAGEMCTIDLNKKHIDRYRYFEFRHFEKLNIGNETLCQELELLYTNTIKRTVKILDGRTAVIPLSGGYDSRLIVYLLNKLNYKDVICFSYGNKNDLEVKISKKVADYYGYKWFFVEYKKQELFELYKKDINDYVNFACNLSSAAHTQDLLAVKKLKEKNIIPLNSVFLPGHTGDMVVGNHIPIDILKQETYTHTDIVESVYNRHYGIQVIKDDFKLVVHNKIKEKIFKQITFKESYSQKEYADELEKWNWQERQPKYICNSIKVYEYYGYSWTLPLWDNEVMSFWSKVDLNNRLSRKLYVQYFETTNQKNIPLAVPTILDRILNKLFYKTDEIWFGRFFARSSSHNKRKILLNYFDANITCVDYNKKILDYDRVGLNILVMYKALKEKKSLHEK